LVKEGCVVGILGIARDITERKKVQDGLRRLNQMLEQEAKRIAHALHDEAGQLLASAHIALDEAVRELPARHRPAIQRVKNLLDQSELQLRNLAHELRPTILDNLGLLAALEFLADGVSKRTRLDIRVEGTAINRLPPGSDTALYRIAQEALNNVVKHARAGRVEIKVWPEAGEVRCSIRDDGIGFDQEALPDRRGDRGLGLIGIQERLHALGGAFYIHSAPGRGTELVVTIPMEVRDAAQNIAGG
jgi:signal transduction histidine kinase